MDTPELQQLREACNRLSAIVNNDGTATEIADAIKEYRSAAKAENEASK